MNRYSLNLITFLILVVSSCSENNQKSNDAAEEIVSDAKEQTSIFGINGENVPIRIGPGEKSEKLINEKATKILGTKQYCEVDHSTKVALIEKKGEWAKIKVVDPEWLSETYVGWIPAKLLITAEEQEKQSLGSLEKADYEILKTEHNTAVENYHVWLKRKNFDRNYVYQFIKQFRKENCRMNCNVILYDSKSIVKLIGVYPLPDNDYLKMADHLISISTFDAADVRDWYPYQDFHYRELGGVNWKKEPIQ
jgi:hypothetical protein